MIIEGLQKTTLLDYPGYVACTVFAHGCNLRCPFCHNAGLVVRKPENIIEKEELAAFLQKRKGILDGVCLTGGEPLMQKDAIEFIEFLKSFGYKVKLDTNGFYPDRLAEIIERGLVDYIAMDIKSSKQGYAKAVGIQDIDIAPAVRSVELIMGSGIDYEFRTTAVKGLHLVSDFEEIGRWLSGAKRYFIQQFIDSGDLICSGLEAFTREETEKLLAAVRKCVPAAEMRGL
ncbi:MAG: anaerobic ribonucleoside-triphosphate reductase activating protein [Clostridia bacterium]|nr:anaerobic ribonucleoside-triphosphate reductase activating protein [Clostridia bacterium]MBR5858668.1 anaerobic ribonucleoside-triphosphate reductase activating protein [Clostridia bacterium]